MLIEPLSTVGAESELRVGNAAATRSGDLPPEGVKGEAPAPHEAGGLWLPLMMTTFSLHGSSAPVLVLGGSLPEESYPCIVPRSGR